MNNIKVLNKGYVRLVEHMGSDLSVVNAARVSFNKESQELKESDKKLIKFLIDNNHFSPFRHCNLEFEIYAPLMVARQWWKHIVGGNHHEIDTGWNESSRRYVTEEPEFYFPSVWHKQSVNKKQGASGEMYNQEAWTLYYTNMVEKATNDYHHAVQCGMAVEQARAFLPAYFMYIRWRWNASLQAVLHFLDLRVSHEAQFEIQEYAKAIQQLTEPLFLFTFESWNK